jgi:hypothetical protein
MDKAIQAIEKEVTTIFIRCVTTIESREELKKFRRIAEMAT